MRLGMIGLGRMGGNMARRLRRRDIDVVGYDRDTKAVRQLVDDSGLDAAATAEELVSRLTTPRAVWLMLPAGEITETTLAEVAALLDPGDIVIDGGNANFHDSMRRAELLREQRIRFVDAGVSGGIWGLEEGYSLMLGGPADAVGELTPIFEALAPHPQHGWLHAGPAGSGHFVKMVHNGIEYGMMQAYAEGLALLKARGEFNLDLAAVTELWRHGSVVRSWLLDLTAGFLAEDQELGDTAPYVADSGEGRWTAIEAVEQGIPAPVISTAIMMRFASQGQDDYAARLLAKMRQAFGGHALGGPAES